MTVISIRIDDAVKGRMNELKHINWSEIIREEIIRILKREERRDLAKALLLNEDLRRDAPKGFDSTEMIRHWRERDLREILDGGDGDFLDDKGSN